VARRALQSERCEFAAIIADSVRRWVAESTVLARARWSPVTGTLPRNGLTFHDCSSALGTLSDSLCRSG
jgi:hypothetical protein